MKKITKEFGILYIVRFQTDDNCSPNSLGKYVNFYFSEEEEAEKCAKIPFGFYGSGKIEKTEIELTLSTVLPKFYGTIEEWAQQNLTLEQYGKYVKSS